MLGGVLGLRLEQIYLSHWPFRWVLSFSVLLYIQGVIFLVSKRRQLLYWKVFPQCWFLNRHDGTSFIIFSYRVDLESSWYWNTILAISIACQTRSLTTITMQICQLSHVQKITMYGANFGCLYFLDVIQSLVGSMVWLLVLIIWISIFQLNRASWGKIGDQLSFIIPLNRVWHN